MKFILIELFIPIKLNFNLGVGLILRKTAGSVKPTLTISKNGNQWTIKVQSSIKTQELIATEDVEFDESKKFLKYYAFKSFLNVLTFKSNF